MDKVQQLPQALQQRPPTTVRYGNARTPSSRRTTYIVTKLNVLDMSILFRATFWNLFPHGFLLEDL
jgi:hypothetical protein